MNILKLLRAKTGRKCLLENFEFSGSSAVNYMEFYISMFLKTTDYCFTVEAI